MPPIYKEDKLSVDKITNCWSQEIQPPRSREELQDFLEAAWWRGELKTDTSFTRLALLKSMFRSARAGDLPKLVFVTQENPMLPQGIKLPDGGLLFNTNDLEKPRILVPSSDPEAWTEASCASAFEVLAQLPSREHYPDRTIQFLMMEIYHNQFIGLLSVNGLDWPNFWRAAVEKPQEVEATKSPPGGSSPKPVPAAIAVKDKGGAPPKADWDALKEPLRTEIKKHGYPDPQNPPGWQRTKDVVHFALAKLGKVDVSYRTVEDNVRRILKELKASGQ